jgi:hypothetical protein
MNSYPQPTGMCWICGKVVDLKTCKTDEHGNAVHGECYAANVALRGRAQPSGKKITLEHASQDGHTPATRPWKVVAAEVSREQDPKKFTELVTELVTELNHSLEEQDLDGTPKSKPDGKTNPDK